MVLFAWAMLALTFPAGLLVSGIAAVAADALEHFQVDGLIQLPAWLGISLLWLAFLAIGYLQWFKALPRLWRRVSIQRGA